MNRTHDNRAGISATRSDESGRGSRAMRTRRSGVLGNRGAARIGIVLLAFALALGSAFATTATFRQGESGYAGTKDTFLQQNPSSGGTNNGAAQNLNWDGDDPNGTGYDVYSLLRFDSVFGSGAGQVPLGAQITSATLSYVVYNNGADGELHEVLVTWDPSTATYNSFCGGGCSEGLQYGATVGTAPAGSAALQSADVTATVQRWSDGTANRGWFIVTAGTDGVDVRSSEWTTVSERPVLRIVYNEGPPTSNLVRQPYLQLVTPTSMTIVWRTDVATNSRVQYGTVFGTYDLAATNATAGTDHYVTITGLTPSTKYYYTVGSTTTQQGGGTAEHYFTTAPTVGTSPRAFRFWIFGDSGICSDIQNQVRNSMVSYVSTHPPAPDLFLHAGDVAQVSGADDEYTNCHIAYYTTVMRHTPFLPAMGNHDSYSTTCQDPGLCTGPYFSTFVLPSGGEMGGVASNTEAYYSWDYGNAHFIVLNGANVSRSSTGPMANWLRNDLAATTQQWVIAYWHQPPYTKGTHDSDTEGDLIEMRQNILPILEAAGVDLVLNGHSHGYERSYLVDGTYSTPTPTYSTLLSQGHIVDSGDGKPAGAGEYLKSSGKTPHEGTVYVVTATGGQGPGGAHGHPVMYYSESANGSTLVDVGSNELNLTFLRSDGVVRDTFTIRKGDLPPRVQTADPTKGSVLSTLPYVEVTFNMAVSGVDPTDLTVNGTAATSVQAVSASTYRFTGYSPPGQGTVSVVLVADSIASVDNPSNIFSGDAWTYTIDLTPPRIVSETPTRGSVIGALPSVTVAFSKPVTGVAAGNLTVNGSPATSVAGSLSGPYIFSGYAVPPNGLVTIALAAGSIQDLQGQSFAGSSWNYALTRRLVINEFLSSNNTAATDEYGEFDDYVEIYNPTDATVDMSGMFLTDDLDSKSQYRIPTGVTVPPHGHVVFWCDSTPSQGAMHTNFNIARTGEDLGLFDTEENGLAAIDTLTFTTQTTDVAMGRFPDGIDGFVVMPVTPGAANTISCSSGSECAALTDACNVGVCTGNRCVGQPANEGGTCDDGVACTAPDTCAAGVCNGGVDTCPSGQTCNRGTGICEATALDPLPIDAGETWRYFKGTQEPTPSDLTAWAGRGYDDGSWLSGPSGFGYGADCSAQRGTLLSDMLNTYTSVYLRKAFRVDNPTRVTSLTLTVDYDDAFVAYLNGTEVARSTTMGGTPGTPPAYNYALTSGTNHECSACDTSGSCNAAQSGGPHGLREPARRGFERDLGPRAQHHCRELRLRGAPDSREHRKSRLPLRRRVQRRQPLHGRRLQPDHGHLHEPDRRHEPVHGWCRLHDGHLLGGCLRGDQQLLRRADLQPRHRGLRERPGNAHLPAGCRRVHGDGGYLHRYRPGKPGCGHPDHHRRQPRGAGASPFRRYRRLGSGTDTSGRRHLFGDADAPGRKWHQRSERQRRQLSPAASSLGRHRGMGGLWGLAVERDGGDPGGRCRRGGDRRGDGDDDHREHRLPRDRHGERSGVGERSHEQLRVGDPPVRDGRSAAGIRGIRDRGLPALADGHLRAAGSHVHRRRAVRRRAILQRVGALHRHGLPGGDAA